MRSSTLLVTLCLTAVPGLARAASPVDMVEHLLGASNTNAVAGHGALTAGFSSVGDLTVLAWPGPSGQDQLAYISQNDLNVRKSPNLGALPGMGSYVGLIVDFAGTSGLTWLRDGSWEVSQSYSTPDSPVPVTTFQSSVLGLTVTLTDVVSPSVDVLTRHVRVTRDPSSAVTAASMVVYENLSPTLSRIPQLPLADWALDSRNDFLAVYDATTSSILHFHPSDRGVIKGLGDVLASPTALDFGKPIDALMQHTVAPTAPEVAGLLSSLDSTYGSGVAALVTTEPPPTSFQVGSDATPLCAQVDTFIDNLVALPGVFPDVQLPADPTSLNAFRCVDPLDPIREARGWAWKPEDALSDLADGKLSGSLIAAAQTNGALITPLTFDMDQAEGAVVFALGPSLTAARAALAAEKARSFAARRSASEAAAHNALASVALPDPELGERVTAVAQRALVNLYVARDRQVGAMVASISRQPPYYLDWPRDGAFFTAALDIAGLGDWATQRQRWYAGLLRTDATRGDALLTPNVTIDPDTGAEEFPANAWEMNYFADGTPGGAIRFEIDNTALHVWSVASHAGALGNSARQGFVKDVWPSSNLALDLLARWKDGATGLPAPANEDDNYAITSTLHGATATYAGLIAGARLAHVAGDDKSADRYLGRARELKESIFKAYYDETTGLFRGTQDGEPGPQGGASAWAVWPARLFDRADERLEPILDADMERVLAALHGETDGGAYLAKNIVAAALYGKAGGSRDKAREALTLLADVATADTAHFGEVFVTEPTFGGGMAFSNRVATPHVWEGIMFYLSAMAFTAPGRFDPEDRGLPFPPEHVEGALPRSDTECSARGGASEPGSALPALALCALAAWARRKRR